MKSTSDNVFITLHMHCTALWAWERYFWLVVQSGRLWDWRL